MGNGCEFDGRPSSITLANGHENLIHVAQLSIDWDVYLNRKFD